MNLVVQRVAELMKLRLGLTPGLSFVRERRDAALQIIVDSARVLGSDMESIVVVSTLACKHQAAIYLGHRVGVCSYSRAADCAEGMMDPVLQGADDAKRFLQRSTLCAP